MLLKNLNCKSRCIILNLQQMLLIIQVKRQIRLWEMKRILLLIYSVMKRRKSYWWLFTDVYRYFDEICEKYFTKSKYESSAKLDLAFNKY